MAEAAAAPAAAASSIAVVPASQAKRSPSDFLKSVIGRPVVVRLTTGTDFKGACAAKEYAKSSRDKQLCVMFCCSARRSSQASSFALTAL